MSTALSAAFVVESCRPGTAGVLSLFVAKLSQYFLKAYPGNQSPAGVFSLFVAKLSQYFV
jgi:hypothetical protein